MDMEHGKNILSCCKNIKSMKDVNVNYSEENKIQ